MTFINPKEIQSFFGEPIDDLDSKTAEILMNNSRPAIYFMQRYRRDYSKEFRCIILENVMTALEGRYSDIYEGLLDTSNSRYFNFLNCLSDIQASLSGQEMVRLVIRIASICFGKTIVDEIDMYLVIISRIVNFQIVLEELHALKYWVYGSRSEICFVTPFLSLCHKIDRQITQFDSLNLSERYRALHLGIYELIHSLINRDKILRDNFLSFLSSSFDVNKEFFKIAPKENANREGGFRYNMSCVLCLFCQPIVEKKLLARIDETFAFSLLNLPFIDEKGDSSGKNRFVTEVFIYNICYLYFSYVCMIEELNEIEMLLWRLKNTPRPANVTQNMVNDLVKTTEIRSLNILIVIHSNYTEDLLSAFLGFYSLYISRHNLPDILRIPLFKILQVLSLKGNFEISDVHYLAMSQIILCKSNFNFKEDALSFWAKNPYPLSSDLTREVLKIYIDVGKEDFSVKYTIRSYVSQIMCNDRNFTVGKLDNEHFVRMFVRSLILDLEQLLDNGLTAIIEIKKLLGVETEENERILSRHQSVAQNSFKCLENLLMLALYIMTHNPSLFYIKETRVWLVKVLNYNLKLLVGPKCASLTVSNMEKYNFKPKFLLTTILKIIISLTKLDDFVQIFASDEHFSPNLFQSAINICTKRALLGSREIMLLSDNLEKIKSVVLKQNNDFEVPDEFLDPLTAEIMLDPYRLLTSNKVVDKSTLDFLMVGDCIDPFSRQTLTYELAQPETELRLKVQEFLDRNK